jgi:hypothetical protein
LSANQNFLHLKEFYDTCFKPNNSWIYEEFKGFDQFDPDYDIEIFETTYDKRRAPGKQLENVRFPLGQKKDNTFRLPKYLTDMDAQINGYNETLRGRCEVVSRRTGLSVKYYEDCTHKGLLLLLNYKSGIPNATYVFGADLRELAQILDN